MNATALLAALLLGPPLAAQTSANPEGPQVWTLPSDGSWIAETVSLGDHGGEVFTEYGLYVNRRLLLSRHEMVAAGAEPEPAWIDQDVTLNYVRQVTSARRASVHLALHQEHLQTGASWRQAVLHKYTSSSDGVADWRYESPVLISNHSRQGVRVSSDGARILLAVHDYAVGRTRANLLDPDTGGVLLERELDLSGALEALRLSADGTTLAATSRSRVLIYDVRDDDIEYLAHFVLPFGSSNPDLAISGDGGRVAFSTQTNLWVASRQGQTYGILHQIPMGPAETCRKLAMAEDGSLLVAGLGRTSQPSDVRILALDVETGAVRIDHRVEGEGGLHNLVSGLAVSSDGSRFAVGLWGASSGSPAPKVLTFRSDVQVPVWTYDLVGSVLDLDLSPDGRWLAVASKGLHATEWGGGGQITLLRMVLPDLTIEGLPKLGRTIRLRHLDRPMMDSQVMRSTYLAATPGPDPDLGEGLLFLDPEWMEFLEPVASPATEPGAFTELFLDPEMFQAGDELYFQARNLSESRLSKTWVKLTVLP